MHPLTRQAKPVRTRLFAIVLVAFAAIRIASTFRIYSQTVDEATHVGAGLQLLQSHHYKLQNLNPPLPRVVWGGLAMATGMRINESITDYTQELLSVFGRENYRTRLFVVRMGSLPFFFIACIGVFLAARDAFGERAALIALFLFTMEPIVLGYSGLATHDGPATAGVAIAMVAATRWLRQPDLMHSVAVGVAYALSVLCKFSCIAFVPAACGAIWLVRLLHDRRPRWIAETLKLIAVVAVVAPLLIWAGYAFTFDRIPAPDFFDGIKGLMRIEREGVRSYLCGEVSASGWWWYFPFAFALKTTLTFFVLFATAAWFALRERESRWVFLEWSAAAVVMMALCIPSSIDLGIRYLLPMYVPLAIATAIGIDRVSRVPAAVLLAIHFCVSLLAHPDYFPYFNALAGRDPSRYLLDSNLDWGQDVLRLRDTLKKEHADKIATSLLAMFDYEGHAFPPHDSAHPWKPTTGWVAVSDYSYRMTFADGGWRWLENKPYRRVGKSIRLYRFNDAPR